MDKKGKVEKWWYTYATTMKIIIYRIVGDNEVAEELVQDAFVNAWRAFDRGIDECREKSWLLTIARNAALDYVKSSHAKKSCSFSDLPACWDPEDQRDMTYQIEQKERLAHVLAQMTPKERSVLMLRAEQIPLKEIATQLNLASEAAVKSIILRARRKVAR